MTLQSTQPDANNEWITRRLGDPDIAQLVMGQSPPSSTYNSESNGLPFFQGKADFGYISPKPRVWCSAPLRRGQQDDVLMSVRAPVGDVNLATEECALGRGVAAIRPSKGTNGIFLFYALQFNKPQLVAASSGAIFESINKTALHELALQLPPKHEQEKIAAILWKLQRAIATQDRLLKATRDLKQSAMQRLFTCGLRGEPLKDTEIGPLPASWVVKSLGDFGRIGNGSTPKKTRPEYWRNGTTPWLTSAKVHEGIIRRADQYVSDVAVKECHLPVVPCGSLLVAITGQGKTLGNAALVEFDTTINQHLAYVRFDRDDVHPAYVYQFMRSRYEELQAIGRAGGSTKAALTCAFLRDYRVPCPPLNEQRDIAAALTTIDRKLAHHQRKRAALDDLFQSTLHQLMTAQIRVADLDIDISEVVQ